MATPDQQLHQAVRSNDMKTVESLLAKGVEINCLFYGWTPLQLAIENGKTGKSELSVLGIGQFHLGLHDCLIISQPSEGLSDCPHH